MPPNYELKLQQDNDIINKVRNLNWDLPNMLPGFLIQLRVRHAVQDQNTPELRATSSKPDKFLYVDRGYFLSYFGMTQCLSSILAQEGIPVDDEGKFLGQNWLRLLRANAGAARPPVFSPSAPICTLPRLAERVLDHAKFMHHSQRNRFLKFVPLAMDLTMIRNQQFQFQFVDEAVILGSEPTEGINSKKVAVPVKLVEGIIQTSCSEKDCSICLDKDCSICLDSLAVGQLAARTPCNHGFHKKCIARWLTKSQTCPLCRADFSRF